MLTWKTIRKACNLTVTEEEEPGPPPPRPRGGTRRAGNGDSLQRIARRTVLLAMRTTILPSGAGAMGQRPVAPGDCSVSRPLLRVESQADRSVLGCLRRRDEGNIARLR